MKPVLSSLMLALLFAVACNPQKEDQSAPQPVLQANLESTGAGGVTINLSSFYSTGAAALCVKADGEAPSATTIASSGVHVSFDQSVKDPRKTTISIDNLDESTAYIAYCVSYNSSNQFSNVQKVVFSTAEGAVPFEWEATRTSILSYDNLDLVYGGSAHRYSNGMWDLERFKRHITYKDASGVEHWLFDAFLAIEFVMTQYDGSSLITNANGRKSGTKETWQGVIDYWFKPGQGFDALDDAVGEAKLRIGAPPKTRKVVMCLPDAIPNAEYNSLTSATIYWGSLDGEKMDFAKAENRLRALKWYIDQVREKWDKAHYQNIELAGFYIINEAIATEKYGGWGPEYTRWDEILPAISKYLHSVHESLSWIPYYEAYGWSAWKAFEFDYVQMQPNYFWGKNARFSKSAMKDHITSAGISMELEMDSDLLTRNSDAASHRRRFREYMEMAREFGLYGKREFSYYMGEDAFNLLAKSNDEDDKAVYYELCEFVSRNIR
ncbi:MAG: DUF4855 domain-containing protein [Bacteroidales bacterium]|nr:DUF4855 domain-containing protein [Bacteroidales bacterium]